MPKICELRVWESDLFKGYYCSLCKALKREYKKSAILNYDCTFIYLLADSIKEEKTTVAPCKCVVHPVEKRSLVVSESASYGAALNVILFYAKLLDDNQDKEFSSRLIKPFFKRAYIKAKEILPSVAEKMEKMVKENTKCELKKTKSTDEAAYPFAHFMGEVLSDIDIMQSHILYDLGYSLGRWVYLIDAIDDYKKDMEKNEYNVYTLNYEPQALKGNKEIYNSMCYTLSQVANALERLSIKKNKDILKNIVYLGLKEKTKKVLGLIDESI